VEKGYIPTLTEIQQVYATPEESLKTSDPDKFNRWKDIALFYFDVYLPVLAGDAWSKEKRCYSLMVETMEIDGKQRPLVPTSLEAFGFLVYENCLDKWTATAEEVAKNSRFKAPTYKKDKVDTHKFHTCKWSDPRAGQGNGWKPDAFKRLAQQIDNLKEWRGKDKQCKYEDLKMIRDLLKEHHGIPLDQKAPVPKSSRRKRKRPTTTTYKESDFTRVVYKSDEEGSYHEADGNSDEE
jgi:hypothetical protein